MEDNPAIGSPKLDHGPWRPPEAPGPKARHMSSWKNSSRELGSSESLHSAAQTKVSTQHTPSDGSSLTNQLTFAIFHFIVTGTKGTPSWSPFQIKKKIQLSRALQVECGFCCSLWLQQTPASTLAHSPCCHTSDQCVGPKDWVDHFETAVHFCGQRSDFVATRVPHWYPKVQAVPSTTATLKTTQEVLLLPQNKTRGIPLTIIP